MDQRTSDVRQDIEDTRAAMTEKIELLEERVRETVEGAKTKVKHAVDLSYHVEQRPWQMMGLSIVTGYLLGRMTASPAPVLRSNGRGLWGTAPSEETQAKEPPSRSTQPFVSAPSSAPAPKARGNWWAAYQDELDMLKGAAVGAVAGFVRDMIRQSVPALAPYLKPSASDKGSGQTTAAVTPTTSTEASRAAQASGGI